MLFLANNHTHTHSHTKFIGGRECELSNLAIFVEDLHGWHLFVFSHIYLYIINLFLFSDFYWKRENLGLTPRN